MNLHPLQTLTPGRDASKLLGNCTMIFGKCLPGLDQDFIVKPDGFNIPYESYNIHGISDALAKSKGVTIEKALSELELVLKKYRLPSRAQYFIRSKDSGK